MAKYECEHGLDVRGFEDFDECRWFVWERTALGETWSYRGEALVENERWNELAFDMANDDKRDFTAPYEP